MAINPLAKYWKSLILVLIPIIFLPIPLCIQTTAANCGYVMIIMAFYWMTEALPLPVTSLLPVALYPLLGIMSSSEVTLQYMKETNMVFVGGLIVAIAVEHCNLHKRIALTVLLTVGTSPRFLLIGNMFTTMFLSMWISNTAAVAMMLPIANAILDELNKTDEGSQENLRSEDLHSNDYALHDLPGKKEDSTVMIENGGPVLSNTQDCLEQAQPTSTPPVVEVADPASPGRSNMRTIEIMIMLGLCYGANIGGTGILTGTLPNLILMGIVEENFGLNTDLSYATWMAFNVPVMLVNTILAWIWLQYLYIGFRKLTASELRRSQVLRQLIQKQYNDLGPMSYHEWNVLGLFLVLVVLWFFRDPKFIPGWMTFIPKVSVGDSAAAIVVVLLLFALPASPKFFICLLRGDFRGAEAGPALLTWKVIHEKLAWGVILVMGGGFAMSKGCAVSGLSEWLGDQLRVFDMLPGYVIVLIFSVFTAFITEVASNAATANILLPVLSELAVSLRVNPIYFNLPTALACSYAFMLPVGTPPNAIVYSACHMDSKEMIKAGVVIKIICLAVMFIGIHSLGYLVFDFNSFPEWAVKNATAF